MPLPLKFWLARGAELTAKLRVHLGVLATLKGDDALPVTLALMDLVAKRPERLHDFMEAAVDKAERDPGFNELKADAYQPPPLDLEVLATFEHGTLGRTVALIPVLSSPGKSRNDPEVIAAANEHGMTMIFTGRRHFKH